MWDSESYTIAAQWLPRLLGCIYLCAIVPFHFQILGLIGKNGILPVQDYLDHFRIRYPRKRFFYLPTLFWLNANDFALMALVSAGTLFSIFLILGFYPSLLLALLFIIYLSIVTVGQDFLSFGWESFLLEITFYTFWVSLTPIPNPMIWFSLNFLLFRFHLQAGACKLQSGDWCWRDLTALWYHYQSQPLPNTWAWFVHKCPLAFHRISTFLMFAVELAIPFGLFFNDEIRAAVGVALISLQVVIWLTGNFSYLNHMTIVFSTITFSNDFFPFLEKPLAPMPSNPFLDLFISIIGIFFTVLQFIRLWNHLNPRYRFLNGWFYWFSPFHLVNRYGLFAIMTKERYEIIVEGSEDGKNWKEYLCKYKPSEITRRPRRISPYQPRLDWQMWFLPFDDFEAAGWFHQFLYHLVQGTPAVLKLLRHNPFPNNPPKYIRAVVYEYKFSTLKQKREYGWWWQREFIGQFSPVMALKSQFTN